MSRLTAWRAAVIIAAFVAWPLVATAQSTQQNDTEQQPTRGQSQGTTGGQQGAGQGQPQGQQPEGPQYQGSDSHRLAALARLTAARQDLADVTKLPAATHMEGQARNDLNLLISNFNALITSTGPEWRQAYDRVQANLNALLGPAPEQGGQQSAVGTSGTQPPPPLEPDILAKLSDMRQQIDRVGQAVGVKSGQRAAVQEQNPAGGQTVTGTSGSATNEQVLRTIDQINAIVSRLLSQGPSDQMIISVSRQDLQQIQQYLNQLRQSSGQQPIR